MKPDLKSMSRKQLEKLSADIDVALARDAQKQMRLAKVAAEKAAKAHGFTLAELTPDGPASAGKRKKATKKPKKPGAPKYANPDDKTTDMDRQGAKTRLVPCRS